MGDLKVSIRRLSKTPGFSAAAIVVLALTIVVALACAAAWTAVSRVTFGGASSQ